MTQYLIQCCTRGRFSITTYQLGKWHSHTHLIYPPSLVVRSRTEGSESDSSWHCPGNQHTAWHQGSKEICAITRGPRQATDTEFQSRPVAGGGVPPPPRFANPRMRQRNGDAAQREQRTEDRGLTQCWQPEALHRALDLEALLAGFSRSCV